MDEHQLLAIRALNQMRGDDSARYRAQAARLTPEARNAQWGLSGKTFQEIYDASIARESEIDQAVAWIESRQ